MAVIIQHNNQRVITISKQGTMQVQQPTNRSRLAPLTTNVTSIGDSIHPRPISPSLSSTTRAIAAESIQIGQPVRMTSGGLALACSTEDRYHCIGLALQNVNANQLCLYASDGTVTRANWQDIIGTIELTIGSQYVLGAIAGTLTTVLPVANAALMHIGIAVSTNILDIQLGELVVLSNI